MAERVIANKSRVANIEEAAVSVPAAQCAFADGVTGQHAQPPHQLQKLELVA